MAKQKREKSEAEKAWEKAKADAEIMRERYNKTSSEANKKAFETAKEHTTKLHKAVRRENFVRLLNARGKIINKTLKNVQSLTNKSQYEYGEEDVANLKTRLTGLVESVVTAFEAGLKSGGKTTETEEEKWV